MKTKLAATGGAAPQTYVDDVFSTYLYTGNGSTQTINNGIDLAGKGGLVWVKCRDLAISNLLYDTARGTYQQLISNNADVSSNAGLTLTSFNNNGFSIGSNLSQSPYNFASWTFRKAAKFFDVVTYTGDGSARTIAHSLGVAPGMIIVKRTDTTGNWQVYSNGLTSAAYSIQLNLTNAQASAPTVWNSTAPTSSVFSVGTDATVNASGGTYVAYLFAHDTSSTGIIQCGSFTSAPGIESVTLGWEPQWLLYKRADPTTGGWTIVDSMRGVPTGSASVSLSPNTSAAETAGPNITFSATGFSMDVGSTGDVWIYMAIRRPNKPPTSGTQVFSPNSFTGASIPVVTNFPVDMSFYREADVAFSEEAFTRLQGIGVYLTTPSTNAEQLSYLSANYFASNTTFCGSEDGNSRKRTYWNFKRAPGFFDEVCDTGTGSAHTVNHNLGVAPELIIRKCRGTATNNNWVIYAASEGATKGAYFNTAAFQITSSFWNDTSPTSSVFTVGSGNVVNQNTLTFVTYLFATLAGISKVGSYTGNGTGQAIACGFGAAGARFVLIKRTDAAGDWYTFDSARGLTSGSSPYLLLNSTAAEVTGNNGVYASTGGFTLGSTASTTTNINAATYIFLAVA